MLSRVKEYFIGDLLREEKDTLQYANIVMIYYVVMLSLTLLLPLQIMYFFIGQPREIYIGFLSLSVFLGALIYIKRAKKILLISNGLLVFSTSIFSLNMFMYPEMNIISGLLLACSIHFAFNLLGQKAGIVYTLIHLGVVVLNMVVVKEGIEVSFIKPIIQPLSVQIAAFTLLFIIMVVLIVHYQLAHKRAAKKLTISVEALQLSEERRKKAQSTAHIGVWDWNMLTNELFWEPETYRIFGIDPEQSNAITTYDTFINGVHPEDREYIQKAVEEALMKEKIFNVDYRLVRPTGEIRYANSLGEIQTTPDGRVMRFYGIVQDITERKYAEAEQKNLLDITSHQNTQLKNFAYIVSHNIRSHSANIISLVDFLETAQSSEEKEMFVKMLKTNARKLEETLRNLNETITITENVSKPKDRKILETEIRKTLDILSGEIYEHKVEIALNIPKELTVNVIPSYLDSILLNLVSNAIKYRSPVRKPVIEISTERNNDFVMLSVKDNGMGLDLKKYGSKIFGMYKTFHNNEDARGIGLFITKNQIEAMKGKIEVDSEENTGTTFRVYFNEKN